jgi:hypothetical protein
MGMACPCGGKRMVTRGQAKRADYILYFKPNIPLALIEAKDNSHSVGDGMQHFTTAPAPAIRGKPIWRWTPSRRRPSFGRAIAPGGGLGLSGEREVQGQTAGQDWFLASFSGG